MASFEEEFVRKHWLALSGYCIDSHQTGKVEITFRGEDFPGAVMLTSPAGGCLFTLKCRSETQKTLAGQLGESLGTAPISEEEGLSVTFELPHAEAAYRFLSALAQRDIIMVPEEKHRADSSIDSPHMLHADLVQLLAYPVLFCELPLDASKQTISSFTAKARSCKERVFTPISFTEEGIPKETNIIARDILSEAEALTTKILGQYLGTRKNGDNLGR